MSKFLAEGLRAGDLDSMVLPMLTIDEFNSKLDDKKMIVVGFYSFEEEPAHDLSNFIERSPTQVQDTDVSPAPSKEGYYLTFVEFLRNDQFPERLIALLKEITLLTNIQEWQFTSLKLDKGKLEIVNPANLRKYVDIKPVATKPVDQVKEWLNHSSLSNVHLNDADLILVREGIQWNMEFMGISENIPQQGFSLDEAQSSLALRLERLLEGGYQVHALTKSLVVEHPTLPSYMMVRVRSI